MTNTKRRPDALDLNDDDELAAHVIDDLAYEKFLNEKRIQTQPSGFMPIDGCLPAALFPFQRDIAQWALQRGKAAIFADTGMGKTAMQLVWADQVARHTEKPVLILAPLAVAQQTQREGEKFGIAVAVCRTQADVTDGVNITNYEMLAHFSPDAFSGIVLDEASILKAFNGKTRKALNAFASDIPYRLVATATPAPNDIMEIINYAEFLGIMGGKEILALFFTQDGNTTHTWRLKGHAQRDFWRWLATWAVALRKPSDLGYDDGAFTLPPLSIEQHATGGRVLEGRLFAIEAQSLQERQQARRESVGDRVALCAALINASDEAWLVWCNLNSESQALARAIPGAVEVTGSDSAAWKEAAARWFVGDICECRFLNSAKRTTGRGSNETKNTSENTEETLLSGEKREGENSTPPTRNGGRRLSSPPKSGGRKTQKDSSLTGSENLASALTTTGEFSLLKAADAPYVAAPNREIAASDSMLTMTIPQGESEDCFAQDVTTASANSTTVQIDSNAQPCICGGIKSKRVLISKPSIFGFGLNFQVCHHVAFVGLSDSYEQFYQAIRRCWRFGQTHPVIAHVITAETEGAVVANIQRKERQAAELMDNLVREVAQHTLVHGATLQAAHDEMIYAERQASGREWVLLQGDSVLVMDGIESESVGLSVFSPPFPGMYAYTNSPHDMGNTRSIEEMLAQFRYLIGAEKLYRVLMPGRMVCMHITQAPAFKHADGYIGLKDFRGDLIRMMTEEGWIYYGEVTISKDPQVKAQRTKERGLMFKTLATDSSHMRMALADYLLYFRKPGENPQPIRAGRSEKYANPDGWITNDEWIEWARPVWLSSSEYEHGIRETNVLNVRSARETDDERHLAPLQLDVIERAVKLWSAPGDLVFSPFAGIGSEGYMALKLHRRFVGIELKPSYYDTALSNLKTAERESTATTLWSTADDATHITA